MYVVLVYDLKKGRTNKIHKECSQYLDWKQNSLFEGEITESQYEELTDWISNYVLDSEKVAVYRFRSENSMKKDIFGHEEEDNRVL